MIPFLSPNKKEAAANPTKTFDVKSNPRFYNFKKVPEDYANLLSKSQDSDEIRKILHECFKEYVQFLGNNNNDFDCEYKTNIMLDLLESAVLSC